MKLKLRGTKILSMTKVTPVDLEHTPGTSGDAGVKGRWDALSLGVVLTPLVGLNSRTQDWARESGQSPSLLKIDMPAFRPSPRRAYLLRSSSQSITLMPGSGPPENPTCTLDENYCWAGLPDQMRPIDIVYCCDVVFIIL